MDYSSRLAVALVITALAFCGAVVVSNFEDSDAVNYGSSSSPLSSLTLSIDDTTFKGKTFYVSKGSSVSISGMDGDDYSTSPKSVTSGYGLSKSGGSISGTLSKTGTITVSFYYSDPYDDITFSFSIVSVESSGGSTTTNYTVSFSASPSTYGSVSKSSISVPSGTTYSKSGNNLVFKNGSTTLYTITPSAASATSSYTYSFSSWSSTSGTITANKSITANFTRAAVVTYSDPVISVGSAGSTITLTSDVSVTWSISTNATKASLSSTSGTSTKVTPSNYGYIVVKAVHNGNSSYDSTVTLNISRIVYNANGGSGTPSTSYWIQSGSSAHSFSLSSSGPSTSKASTSGDGYTTSYSFKGWGTSSTASSTTSSVSVSYRSSTTVYALWNSSTTYSFTLRYDVNQGSGSISDTNGGTSSSSSKNITVTSSKPTRSGYTFLGWSTSSTATSAAYSSGSSYSFSYGTTTLYAVWKANEPDLVFTSYPTSACVTLPTITYKDNGDYVIA